jgi:hypothetical protein
MTMWAALAYTCGNDVLRMMVVCVGINSMLGEMMCL